MPQRIRYAGLGEEASYAPDPPADPTFHVDIGSASLDAPSDPRLVFEGGIGRSRRLHRPGYYVPSGNIVYMVDVRTIAAALKWTLGGYSFTADGGDAGLNLHECYGSEDVELPSFTARIGKDLLEHVFAGCVVGQAQLEVSDGWAQLTLDVEGARDSKATLLAPTALDLPDEYPLTFQDTTLELAGSDASAKARSLTLTVDNNLASAQGRQFGSRFPARMPAEARNVTAQATVYYDTLEHLERFWGDEAGASEGGVAETTLTVTMDAGDDGQVVLELPRIAYSTVAQQPSGRSEIEHTVEADAFADTVTLEDASEVDTELYVRVSNDAAEVEAA